MELTIFTPTYNRGYCLENLYNSLLQQTNKFFKWIIVDDGSVDNTRELVNKFKKEDNIIIEYYLQKNSGKHVAHNKGVEMCDTELFFCVDSDDYLTSEAVDTILKTWNDRNKSKATIGIVALRGYRDGSVMGNEMPKNLEESTLSNLYNIYGKKGETALIFQTKYLKKSLFPVFDGEKFLSEEVIYNELDTIGPLILLNKIIYLMEYLEDGLTRNYIKQWKLSPKGVIYLLKSRYEKVKTINGLKKFYRYIRVILVLNAFCINRKIPILKNSPNKILAIFLIIPSFLVSYIKFK